MENEKKAATSNTDMVTISRAEYNELKLQNQWLLEQLGLAKKRKPTHMEQNPPQRSRWLTSPSRGASLAACAAIHLLTQKFVMYSPLYRLEQEFNWNGLKLSRQTMANWMLNTLDAWLRPIYDVLHRDLCRETVLHRDETTL